MIFLVLAGVGPHLSTGWWACYLAANVGASSTWCSCFLCPCQTHA